MNMAELISGKPVFSWQVDALPPTLFSLVGDVQEKARGIDFGNLVPSFEFGGTTLAEPLALQVTYRLRNRNVEGLPLPSWQNTDKGIMWKLHDLPFRVSILLSRARFRFPGLGFQMIGIMVDRKESQFILHDLSPKFEDRRLVI